MNGQIVGSTSPKKFHHHCEIPREYPSSKLSHELDPAKRLTVPFKTSMHRLYNDVYVLCFNVINLDNIIHQWNSQIIPKSILY